MTEDELVRQIFGRRNWLGRPDHPHTEVHCPVEGCGCEYLHPVEVLANAGGEITTVDCDGTSRSEGEPDGRGVSIAIRFACENGHETLLIHHFHKGYTLRTFHHVGDYEGDDPDELCIPETIWRD